MKLSKFHNKNVFCIEGNWTNNLRDKASIETALDFLKANADIDFIRKNCAGKEDFTTYLKASLERRYKKFSIVYLAFHGSPGQLHLGNRKNIDFDHIAEILNGEAQDKIIHFGSCSTLNLSGWELRRFLKKTGALAISGYKTDINFIESSVFDILYFKKCQEYRRVATIDKYMKLYYGKLSRELGFKMVYNK